MPDFYKIANERVWDVDSASFAESIPEAANVIELRHDGKPADEAYLRKTLEFYGYTVGDELLAETDYLLMPDYPISEEALAALKTYRQALRDVPEQTGFPNTIEWPSKPEVIL